MENAIEVSFDEGGLEVVKIGEDSMAWVLLQDSENASRQGELMSTETVQVVVDALRRHGPRFVVVDPV